MISRRHQGFCRGDIHVFSFKITHLSPLLHGHHPSRHKRPSAVCSCKFWTPNSPLLRLTSLTMESLCRDLRYIFVLVPKLRTIQKLGPGNFGTPLKQSCISTHLSRPWNVCILVASTPCTSRRSRNGFELMRAFGHCGSLASNCSQS